MFSALMLEYVKNIRRAEGKDKFECPAISMHFVFMNGRETF